MILYKKIKKKRKKMKIIHTDKFSEIDIYEEDEQGVLVIENYKSFFFLKNNLLHSDDGPALMKKGDILNYVRKKINISQFLSVIPEFDEDENFCDFWEQANFWYKKGILHRDDDEPAIIAVNNLDERFRGEEIFKIYIINGIIRRKDISLPSIIISPYKVYTNSKGQLNNIIGPAIYHRSSEDYDYYYINGVIHTEEEWENKRMELAIKYARVWYQKCDKPGTKIWDNNIKKGWDGIKSLQL